MSTEHEKVVTIVVEFPVAGFDSGDELCRCLAKFEIGLKAHLGLAFERTVADEAVIYEIGGIPDHIASKAAKVIARIAKAADAPDITVSIEEPSVVINARCVRCERLITGTNLMSTLETTITCEEDQHGIGIAVTCPDCDANLGKIERPAARRMEAA